MTVAELYANIGGNYDEVLRRLGSDALVSRFIVKVAEDKSFSELRAAWDAGDDARAFRAAHTAKGVYANLAVTRIANLADQITEALREGNEELRAATDVDALMAELTDAYADTVAQINAFTGAAR